MLENPVAGRLLAGLVRRARKDYLGVCFISQQADDFLSNRAGRVIASQAALKILLRADSTAIKPLARQFRLSAVEQDFLLTAERGQALLLAGSKHAIVQIIASEREHPLITTDPSRTLSRRVHHLRPLLASRPDSDKPQLGERLMAEILVAWLVVGSGLLSPELWRGVGDWLAGQGIGELVLAPPLGGGTRAPNPAPAVEVRIYCNLLQSII